MMIDNTYLSENNLILSYYNYTYIAVERKMQVLHVLVLVVLRPDLLSLIMTHSRSLQQPLSSRQVMIVSSSWHLFLSVCR
jgi:hypothetical protein